MRTRPVVEKVEAHSHGGVGTAACFQPVDRRLLGVVWYASVAWEPKTRSKQSPSSNGRRRIAVADPSVQRMDLS